MKEEKLRENEGIHRGKKKYHKPRREIALREIRRLVVDQGLTNRQLSERLNIPEKTIERYISTLYANDNQLLSNINSNDVVLTAWNIVRDRLDHHRQEILSNIARNPNASFADQLKAWNLVCELAAADLRLLNETAAMVARSSALPVRRVMMLKKKEGEEEEQEFEFDTEQEEESSSSIE